MNKSLIWTKRFLSVLLCVVVLISISVPCFAQENEIIVTSYTEDLGDGITGVVTIKRTYGFARSVASDTATEYYYDNGQYIGDATLIATFNYNGITARATSASGSGMGLNGWSYGGQSTRTSGRTAYLTASLTKGSKTVPVRLTLTCDANGNIS